LRVCQFRHSGEWTTDRITKADQEKPRS
jgi:hypothetical protein